MRTKYKTIKVYDIVLDDARYEESLVYKVPIDISKEEENKLIIEELYKYIVEAFESWTEFVSILERFHGVTISSKKDAFEWFEKNISYRVEDYKIKTLRSKRKN